VFWLMAFVIPSVRNMYVHIRISICNGFRDRVLPLYSPKTVGKKELLRTVSDAGDYCPSDKVATVYPAVENSVSRINALCNSMCRMAHIMASRGTPCIL
jgi:hypothetical protein